MVTIQKGKWIMKQNKRNVSRSWNSKIAGLWFRILLHKIWTINDLSRNHFHIIFKHMNQNTILCYGNLNFPTFPRSSNIHTKRDVYLAEIELQMQMENYSDFLKKAMTNIIDIFSLFLAKQKALNFQFSLIIRSNLMWM